MTLRLDVATRDLDPPFAVVDLRALRTNAADLVRRAAGKPVRVASKSVRCRAILRTVLDQPGFHGVLAYTLAEALWLADEFDDVVIAYPTVERAALKQLAADPQAAARVTLMIDSVEQLNFVDDLVPADRPPLRVCLDLDASLRALGGRLHLGTRRSPVHDPDAAAELARLVADRPGFRLVGLMAYEGQVAGLADDPLGQRLLRGPAIRAMKAASVRELAQRRAAVVAAVEQVTKLEFVNGGGTGSVETTVAEAAITEVAAGSGLYAPALFDRYRSFRARPAALFALGVTRRPAPGIVTVAGGGWIASGPPGTDRQPVPTYPAGLRLLGTEGAGEVQTPLSGVSADTLRVGDRVWFRHAKAGELCEHVDSLHLLDGDEVTSVVPTYRGEGKTF
jgi:D-serine deaminase-like pyridoxal phosphate-dependent protein